ncbi:hypothetical protein Dsin_001307 [Dipteronia sinensis]|uniref:Uncharacterized protein n=1 Tax=Dipteronia sinensis TaxID=43782 RepID=A0AAE0B450_9ROSI|nr:hypothetical protein Dsin_001307 [Dipteronia sinensis]
MEKQVFVKLCDRLRSYGLTSTKGVRFEEVVGIFLMTLGHGAGNQIIQEQFQHSGETVSRQFGIVLEKMIMLAFDEIRPPREYNEVLHYIRSNLKYWPYFKGWEGSSHDTRIFLEALRNTDLKFPKPLDAPYKGEIYHLSVFRTSGQPTGSRETFNYMHSSLRSVIEHNLGVWKARWEIFQHLPNYKFDKQVTIVTDSMALHNFIRREVIPDVEFESYDEDEDYVREDEESCMNLTIDESEIRVVRDRIARELMLV